MNKRIIYTNAEGGVSILVPVANCGLTLDEIIKKDVPAGVAYKIVDVSELPTDRTFRNAWTLKDKLDVDLDKAKEIHKDTLRRLRKPFLEALDVEFTRALEEGDTKKQADVVARKKALRDITADPALVNAKTPDELKRVFPDALR